MAKEVIAAAGSLGVTLIALPIILRMANRFRLYDSHGPLKIHTRSVPRLGGIALAAGSVAGIALTGGGTLPHASLLLVVLLLVWGTGLIDDLAGLPPLARLAVQIGAALLLSHAGWSVPLFGVRWLDILATCVFIPGFINAFNLLDGADGVAAGVALVIALGYASWPGRQLSTMGHLAAWSLAAACLAFLSCNFPPARMFMGDSGSTLLGLVIAFLGLDFYRANLVGANGLDARLGVPVVFAALPVVDLILAMVRRIRNRAPIFEGDRQHFYDLLLQHGWPARRVALVCALCTAVFVAIGRVGGQAPASVFTLMVAGGVIPLMLIAIYLGSLRVVTGGVPTVT
jgi:UDP-GlcNAc:undecaprenyl-phosphate/decaprenyl-phosphate GlcNAc-1-phosphate transferase